MIGNDVIDLELAKTESNWQRKGWLEKIFTPSEQKIIADSENQEIMVWLLWSMKESAYKIHHRNSKIRTYIPIRLICSDLRFKANFVFGKVSLNGIVFYTQTTIGSDFVHTIATSHKKLFKKLNNYFSDSYNGVAMTENIYKDANGIPFLQNKTTGKPKILSIAHHGKFCSYISTKDL
ncbi:MAG: 4'-phosphopantetheinyl transferase superfamily protein [Flavobacterium sp.]|nr:4'-phosphopantetheinyl transferase superfamily protein [Flavobacterium sp.]